MLDTTLTVDEGVEDNSEMICVILTIDSGGIVECELEVSLYPISGTAGKSEFELCLSLHASCMVFNNVYT